MLKVAVKTMHISTVNICKIVTDGVNITNMKSHMGFRIAYLNLTLAHSNVKVEMHISNVNISQAVKGRRYITNVIKDQIRSSHKKILTVSVFNGTDYLLNVNF